MSVAQNLVVSQRTLRRLQLRHFTDKVLLLLGFTLFVLVVLYIVLKRLRLLPVSFASKGTDVTNAGMLSSPVETALAGNAEL